MPPVIVSRIIASSVEVVEERKAKKQEAKPAEKGLVRALSRLRLAGTQKPSVPETCPPALWEYGTCVNILQQLVQKGEGLSLQSWLKCSRVCKAWRQAMEEVPVALVFPRKLTTQQFQNLCQTRLHIASITFSEQETAGLELLSNADFIDHQAPYLKRVWNLELSADNALTILHSFKLRSLYACRPAQHAAATCTFSSTSIEHMDELELLSLRGYSHLQLESVPSSVQTLQVGPAIVTQQLKHRVERVIMNGGKGMYLVEALEPYFSSARCLSAYATRMVGRTIELYRPGSKDSQDWAGCVVEDIQLEFNNLVVLDPLANATWTCRDTSRGLELLRERMGGEFIHTEGGGKLHSTRVKLNRIRKKRKARFAL